MNRFIMMRFADSWETQIFRYVEMDELYTNLELGGSIVYKLTDVAQEMIFMSREIAEEFSITIEQLYSMKLIKNGNFRKAARNLDHLISRVNRLMTKEYSFQKEMMNNPKILLVEQERRREDNRWGNREAIRGRERIISVPLPL